MNITIAYPRGVSFYRAQWTHQHKATLEKSDVKIVKSD